MENTFENAMNNLKITNDFLLHTNTYLACKFYTSFVIPNNIKIIAKYNIK